MKQAGRIRWWVILACLALAGVLGLAFLSGPSASAIASEFMLALQAGDVDRLTELSYVPAGQEAKLRKQWDFCIHTATPYYNFVWQPSFSKKIDDADWVIDVKVVKNADNANSYDEDYQLPVVKVGNSWKVDVYRLSGKLYPALPRPNSDL